jgi:hypothetical protein
MPTHERDTESTTTWTRSGLRWLVTFIGFPIGGLVAELIAGPVDGFVAALVGGAVTGAILGAVQAWGLLPNKVIPEAWVAATTAGLAIGLAVGAATVNYGTSLGDLAIQGAISGLAVGLAQGLVLRSKVGSVAFLWGPALAVLWALGWIVTTAFGVDVESQYTVFGSSGALVVTLATAVLPISLTRRGEGRAS